MNCSIFTENLNKFIEEDIEENMKYEMEEHMLKCDACKQIYEEELLIEKAFIESLTLEDINFTSQKEKIMSKIDTDKYKSCEPKKSDRGLLRYIKIIGPLAAAILFVMLVNPISRFKVIDEISAGKKENLEKVAIEDKNNTLSAEHDQKLEKKNIDNKNDISNKNSYEISIKDETSELLNENNLTLNNIENTTEPLQKEVNDNSSNNGIDNINDNGNSSEDSLRSGEIANLEIPNDIFSEKELDNTGDGKEEEQIKSLTGVNINLMQSINFSREISLDKNTSKSLDKGIKSPNTKLVASLAKKEYTSVEKIYVENLVNKEVWSLDTKLQNRNVFTKFIKWADNENLFLVIDEIKENVVTSEEVYVLNINSGKAIQVYKIIDNLKKVEDINIVNNVDIELKLSNGKNDNKNNTYMERYMINNFFITED